MRLSGRGWPCVRVCERVHDDLSIPHVCERVNVCALTFNTIDEGAHIWCTAYAGFSAVLAKD